MLLLFWKSLGLTCGYPNDIRWYHDTSYIPVCFISGEYGLSIINPFMNYTAKECGYLLLNENCPSVDMYKNNLIISTTSGGLYSLSWDSIKNIRCDVSNPANYENLLEPFTTFSGLTGQVKNIAAYGDLFSVVTTSGLGVGKYGNSEYLLYGTISGCSSAVDSNSTIYFAEGSTLRIKNDPSTELETWDYVYENTNDFVELWIGYSDNSPILYAATTSGIFVRDQYSFFLWGDEPVRRVRAERETNLNKGHLFVTTTGTLYVLNMKTREVESQYNYNSEDFICVDNQRINSI